MRVPFFCIKYIYISQLISGVVIKKKKGKKNKIKIKLISGGELCMSIIQIPFQYEVSNGNPTFCFQFLLSKRNHKLQIYANNPFKYDKQLYVCLFSIKTCIYI